MITDTPPAEVRTVINTTVLGTDGITPEGLSCAINMGYNLIDTAMVYGSHAIIAEAVRQSGTPRYLFSIATKIPGSKLDIHHLAKSTADAVQTCLEELKTEYIDVMYLHGPDAFQPEVLDVLKELKKRKMIYHIGLSNATTEQVAKINTIYKISVVQVEFNPYSWDEKLLQYCLDKKIDLVGYRPFRGEDSLALLNDPTLVAIASKINTTVPRLILEWVRQNGVLPIARANSREHLESNFKQFSRSNVDEDSNTTESKGKRHLWKYDSEPHLHNIREINVPGDGLIIGEGGVLENLDFKSDLQPPKRNLTDEEMAAIDDLNQHNPSCLWQQYSDKELLSKSEAWLNSITPKYD